MTVAVGEGTRRRTSPAVGVTFGLGLLAWIAFVAWATDMGMAAGPGTMGLSSVGFLVMWTLMMAAMMLPTVAPLVSLYARSVQNRPGRLVMFGAGYVLAWASTGVVAFGLASLFDELAQERPGTAHGVAVVALAGCGVYQLTPMKRWCLRHCRSPIGHLLTYANYKGTTRDLRAGSHHGLLCIGCCWMLMVGLVVVGVMNLPVMLGLAVLIALEKRWRYGEHLARAVGVGAILFAIAVAFAAGLAPGLNHPDKPMPMDEMSGTAPLTNRR